MPYAAIMVRQRRRASSNLLPSEGLRKFYYDGFIDKALHIIWSEFLAHLPVSTCTLCKTDTLKKGFSCFIHNRDANGAIEEEYRLFALHIIRLPTQANLAKLVRDQYANRAGLMPQMRRIIAVEETERAYSTSTNFLKLVLTKLR